MVNDGKAHGINALTERVLKKLDRAERRAARDKDEPEAAPEIAHVTPGEIVIPRALQKPELMQALGRAPQAAGLDPGRFQVGNHRNSVNPRTGRWEFAENPYVDQLPPLASLAGMQPPPTSIFPDRNSARGRAFDFATAPKAARILTGEVGDQSPAAQDKAFQTMLSRVGSQRRNWDTLNDVLDDTYTKSGVEYPQYNAVTMNPVVKQPIDQMAPANQQAYFSNVARATNGLIDAAVNGVDYGLRFFRSDNAKVPNVDSVIGKMTFHDPEPNYPRRLYPKGQ